MAEMGISAPLAGDYSDLWVPSQNGEFFEARHPQRYLVSVCATVTFVGTNSLPLWAPSQNGWFFDLPHAQ